MSLITPAMVYKLLDDLDAMYLALWGTSGSGLGVGDGTWGASEQAQGTLSRISGATDTSFAVPNIQLVLLPAAIQLQAWCSQFSIYGSLAQKLVPAMSTLCAQANSVNGSILNIDTFMYWYNFLNSASYWQCLAPPDWTIMYPTVFGLGSAPNPLNVYFPCIQGHTYLGTTFTNALAKLVIAGPTTTLGYVIPTANYAGSFAYAQWTGATGSGACSITVHGLDQQGNSETWTLTGTWSDANFNATNTGVALVPSTRTYSLISSVTSITVTGMTAGTMYIESRPPSGRVYPPVVSGTT